MFFEQDFGFRAQLEENWTLIRDELNALLPADYVAWPQQELYQGAWDVFGLYVSGQEIEQNCRRCPQTIELLSGVPNLVSAGFSNLTAGAFIGAHTGYTKTVIRCHLGLIVPEDCAIRVGEETRSWKQGSTLAFDDTYEHEAWNRSDTDRIVMLLDFERPQALCDEDTKQAIEKENLRPEGDISDIAKKLNVQ